jgi:hypothetical protein
MGPMVLAMKTKPPCCALQRPGTRKKKLNRTDSNHFFMFFLLQMFE